MALPVWNESLKKKEKKIFNSNITASNKNMLEKKWIKAVLKEIKGR